MEGNVWSLESSTQYALPVGLVLVLAVLVFALGFRSSVEPPSFAFADAEERKPAGTKRKKQQKNQSASDAVDKSSEKREKLSEKKDKDKKERVVDKKEKVVDKKEKVVDKKEKLVEKKEKPLDKKEKPSENKSSEGVKRSQETSNKAKSVTVQQVEELKNRKNEKNLKKLRQPDEKPVDYDDGTWVQAPSRKDKKTKDQRKKDGEALSPGKARRKAEREAKRLLAEQQAKALKEEENNQQQAALQAKVPEPEPEPEVESEPEPEEREQTKKRNRKGSSSVSAPAKKQPEPAEIIIQVGKQPGPLAAEKKLSTTKVPEELAEPVDSNVAFDEMGDVWKEASKPKKSKKKVRKE